MNVDDTIAAIATPKGEGGIGIVRVSGPLALPIASEVFRPSRKLQTEQLPSHSLTHGYIVDKSTSDEIIDEVLLGIMRAPHTYTTEDIVEFNCHGGIVTLSTVLDLVVKAGGRPAEPGEFTKRAFLNGRLDLAQAEAVAELISSKTDLSRKVAIQALEGKLSESINNLSDRVASLLAEIEASIDFPDEDLDFMKIEIQLTNSREINTDLVNLLDSSTEGRILKEGINVAIVGKPNVGKSSLFNVLINTARAIVTDIPGTTRDTIDELINIAGIPINLVDTAGIRYTDDPVEKEGVQRSREIANNVEFLLIIFDASESLNEDDIELLQIANSHPAILVLNKTDLNRVINPSDLINLCPDKRVIQTSIIQEKGVEQLKTAIQEELLGKDFTFGESSIISNVRHQDALRQAKTAIDNVIESLENDMPPDLVSVDLRICLDALGDIVGKTTTEDILDRIFSQFCVGK
ncbi:tRNA uridine-5-carboxymethylaminomethyl(34) synthesis GTPase MnmE [Candidatus Poribacteria bacterium]|nr:tRNA uridine-5-carboxymethylaminomethyl(34) synthesis GTPase MnmE [Candidatus Poribacteria bacterium]